MMNLPIVDMRATGQNITHLRKKKCISVKDLQNIFGFSTPQAIYKWQNGTTLPSLDNLVILAAVFQVNMEDILITKLP